MLAGVRRAEPDRPAVVAAALPAQQLLLEADRATTSGFDIADRIEKRQGRPPLERVVQDIEVPIERCAEFVDWFLANVPDRTDVVVPGAAVATPDRMAAVPDPARADLRQRRLLVVGADAGATEGETNRRIENQVRELDGHKSLYSDSFYTAEEFDELYGGEAYKTLKKTYDPDARFLTSTRRRCNDR